MGGTGRRRSGRSAGSRALLKASPVAIVELDCIGTVVEWNPAAAGLLGWPADQVVGRPLPADILGKPVEPAGFGRLLARLADAAASPTLQLRCRHRQGRLVQADVSLAPLRDRKGRVRGVMAVIIDGTERRRLERKLRYQAQHDSLTSLPNRDMLLACCEAALETGARTGSKTGLLMIDLDKFKEVNDTLGHASGDQLLAQIGPRLLSGTVRTNDLVARLAGDEFAVLLPDLDDASTAVVVAERVLAALHSPFMLDSVSADVAASIGIAVAPEHGEDPNELLQHADIAMYEAKEAAAGICLYEPDRPGRQPTRFGLLGELRRALDRGELVVHYQPKVDISTGALCGAEALVRWQHPDRGLLPPAEFVPVVENTGLMRRLTDYVLDAAIAQVRAWINDGQQIPVSVNLSARGLHDQDLPGRVLATLRRHRVPTGLLCLEITETAIMHDPDSALAVLGELARAGIGLSLDDFGTGYSSMTYLQRLPITELKVDRSFVSGLTSEHADNVLVRTAVGLGHDLHLPVVAEGVENAATLAQLQELGCDVAQGYYLARPMPVEQFDTWLAANHPTARVVDRTMGAAPSVGLGPDR